MGERERMDEQLKQPILVGVLVTNFVFIASQFIFNWSWFMIGRAILGFLVGAAIGGGVFAAMYFMGRK